MQRRGEVMEGAKRREEIVHILLESEEPVSGSKLAKRLKVSRQVIVQDIALLRATDKNILSTNKGYILFQKDRITKAKRVYKVKHADSQMKEELYTIVDFGGEILNVVVEHAIYGQLLADLVVKTRADVDAFVFDMEKYQVKSLTSLTNGLHYHTVEAENEHILNQIEKELEKKGILFQE